MCCAVAPAWISEEAAILDQLGLQQTAPLSVAFVFPDGPVGRDAAKKSQVPGCSEGPAAQALWRLSIVRLSLHFCLP